MLTVTLNCRDPRHLNQIVEEAEYYPTEMFCSLQNYGAPFLTLLLLKQIRDIPIESRLFPLLYKLLL
jgi:hypothetical protein